MKNIAKLGFVTIFISILVLSACVPGVYMPTATAIQTPAQPRLPSQETPVLGGTTVPTGISPLAKSSIPAPVIPKVSAPISPENVSQLTRLTSLGEGDILYSQLSPDGQWIVFSTNNGVLILDSTTLEKVVFLPTAMKPRQVGFIENGKKMTARDCNQGYVWSMPDGKEISHVFFFSQNSGSLEMWNCRAFPDAKWEKEFVLSQDSQKTGLYDLKSGNTLYSLNDDDAQNPVFSPDNNFVVYHTGEKLVVVQNSDGKIIQEMDERGIKRLFFYPDGKILGATFEKQTKFWNFSDFTMVSTANGAGEPIFSPDGSVVVFRDGNTFSLFRAQDRSYINSVTGYGLKFLPDSQEFYVDSGSGQVMHYDLNDDRSKVELTASYPGRGFNIDGFYYSSAQDSMPGAFSADTTKLLLAKTTAESNGDDLSEILVYDLTTNSVAHIKYDQYYGSLVNAFWLPELQTFGVVIKDGDFQTFYILDLNKQKLTKNLDSLGWEHPFIGINFSPLSDLLIFTHGDHFISWNLKNNSYVYFPELGNDQGHLSYDTKIRFSPDDKDIFISDSSNLTYIFDSKNYASLETEPYSRITLGKNYTGFMNGSGLTVHDNQLNKDIHHFLANNSDYDFDPNNKLLATVSEEGLSLWDLSDFFREKLIFSQQLSVTDTNGSLWYGGMVKFSPDGKYLAANKYTRTGSMITDSVIVWDAKEGTQLFEFGPAWSESFAFSQDSKLLAVSINYAYGNEISIFDLSTGESRFATGEYFSEGVEPRIAFSPDGNYLAILPEQGFPQLWGIP